MTELHSIETPEPAAPQTFSEPEAAVERLAMLYDEATSFLCTRFEGLLSGRNMPRRMRAFYPQVAITTSSFAHIDSRLSYGHVPTPGHYAATVTRPAVGGRMPAMVRSVVVLPAPLGPTRPRMSPARTSKLRSLTAVRSPYVLENPSTRIKPTPPPKPTLTPWPEPTDDPMDRRR